MEALQIRLQEESVVMRAAEGLSAEQRMLALDNELSRKIKSLQEIQKDVRQELKAWHKENVLDPQTGEIKKDAPVLQVGPILYAPTVKANWTYDVPAFIKKFGDKAIGCLRISGEAVTAGIKMRMWTEADLADVRTNTPTVSHGTKAVEI